MSVIHALASTANDVANALPTDLLGIDCNSTDAGGVLNKTCEKGNQLEGLLKGLVTVVAIVFVIYKAISSKFAPGTIVISALVAGLLIWIVNQTPFLSGLIGGDLGTNQPGQGAVERVVPMPPDEIVL